MRDALRDARTGGDKRLATGQPARGASLRYPHQGRLDARVTVIVNALQDGVSSSGPVHGYQHSTPNKASNTPGRWPGRLIARMSSFHPTAQRLVAAGRSLDQEVRRGVRARFTDTPAAAPAS